MVVEPTFWFGNQHFEEMEPKPEISSRDLSVGGGLGLIFPDHGFEKLVSVEIYDVTSGKLGSEYVLSGFLDDTTTKRSVSA